MLRTTTLTLLVSLCVLGTGLQAYDVSLEDKDVINLYGKVKYETCDDVRDSPIHNGSGVYNIFPNTTEPISVYCRFEGKATFTAIMGQKYGREPFNRGWNDYKNGFGTPSSGDYWIGLNAMKSISDRGSRVLTITMQDWNNVLQTIKYRYFGLGSEAYRYRLTISGYQGSIPDDFSFNNGMYFATIDMPDANGCAVNQKGGWWYNYCTYMLPTGHYYYGGHYTPPGSYYDGIFYRDWQGYGYSLKYIKMELSVN